MEKQVDMLKVALQLGGVRLALDAILEEAWHKLPEKEGGFTSKLEDFKRLGKDLFDDVLLPAIADYSSGEIDPDNLPEPEPEPEIDDDPPQEEMHGYLHKEVAAYAGPIHISGNYYRKFIFSKNGVKYGKSFLLVWEDGKELHVFDSSYGDGYIIGPGGRKYVAGKPVFKGKDAGYNMEAYAHLGSHPNKCTVYYGK